jgi:hypothetical protein
MGMIRRNSATMQNVMGVAIFVRYGLSRGGT